MFPLDIYLGSRFAVGLVRYVSAGTSRLRLTHTRLYHSSRPPHRRLLFISGHVDKMCYYQETVYTCLHVVMGPRIATCQEQRTFLAGGGGTFCIKKDVHAFRRIRVGESCPKCGKLDNAKSQARDIIKNLRKGMEERYKGITPKTGQEGGCEGLESRSQRVGQTSSGVLSKSGE